MKKFFAVLLSALMLFSLAACGNDDITTSGTDADALAGVKESLDILDTVWATYGDDEKFYAMGGDYSSFVENGPGKCNVSSVDNYAGLLVFPAESAELIDDAASLIHSMNANTFTGAVYHVADTANTEAFIEALRTNIQGNHWMCGFPEKLVISVLGDSYVVAAFGDGSTVDLFQQKLSSCYETINTVCNEPIE